MSASSAISRILLIANRVLKMGHRAPAPFPWGLPAASVSGADTPRYARGALRLCSFHLPGCDRGVAGGSGAAFGRPMTAQAFAVLN